MILKTYKELDEICWTLNNHIDYKKDDYYYRISENGGPKDEYAGFKWFPKNSNTSFKIYKHNI